MSSDRDKEMMVTARDAADVRERLYADPASALEPRSRPPARSGHMIATQSSADLLDLVRSAEEAAIVAAREPEEPRTGDEEFVEVGDEAVDAPPSLPPLRTATPLRAQRPIAPRGSVPTQSVATDATSEARGGLSPLVGLIVLLGLASAALALLAR